MDRLPMILKSVFFIVVQFTPYYRHLFITLQIHESEKRVENNRSEKRFVKMIGTFETLASYIKENPPDAYTIFVLVLLAQYEQKTDQARENNQKRNAPIVTARAWIKSEWKKYKEDYSNNASAFARH